MTDAGLAAATAARSSPQHLTVAGYFDQTVQGHDVAGLGDRARYSESGAFATLTILRGSTLITVQFTDGPITPEKYVEALGGQALKALPA